MALRGGAAGYGGITSMNMDQRESPYYTHNPLLKYRNYKLNKMVVKCLSCHEEWEHDLGNPWSSGPEKCIREDSDIESE